MMRQCYINKEEKQISRRKESSLYYDNIKGQQMAKFKNMQVIGLLGGKDSP